MSLQKNRRKRGVILTPQGFKKLQTAKSEKESYENYGNRYTLEDLSANTGLSVDTWMKVLKSEVAVDKQTLKSCFGAFNLVLETNDYFCPEPHKQEVEKSNAKISATEVEPELPFGQVPLNSAFYIERSHIEAQCYKTIQQPGALIHIHSPRLMGKTSLMARILAQGKQLGYRIVPLSFQLADKAIFQNLDKFLRWFCLSVGLEMQLPNQLANYWDDLFGSKISCKIYFEQYLLSQTSQPVILGLDDVDRLFQYPDLADEFFDLLRSWYEEAKNRDIWQKLRMVVANSTQLYIPLNVNKSPFNIGLPIELRSFTSEQVQDLAQRYGLDWSDQVAQKLISLVGGQPHLVRLALYHICRQDITLEELLQASPTSTGIYTTHLQGQLWNLKQHPDLLSALAQVAMTPAPVELDLVQAFKLQSLGLVHLQGALATTSCQLYAQYFQTSLSKSSLLQLN